MGKPKQRQAVASSAICESNPWESELDGEDSWVIVKKQRVTILVPALSDTNMSTLPTPGPSNFQPAPMQIVDSNSPAWMVTSTGVPSIDRQEIARLTCDTHVQADRKSPAPYVSVSRPMLSKPSTAMDLEYSNRGNTLKSNIKLSQSCMFKTIKHSMLLHGQPGSFLDGSLLNPRLRASLLEKKLQKAGGLNSWLESLGLSQFVKIFKERNASKFLLVNLTMEKLKDMGADAVGPRRKLMHAINCICQPYCFQTHNSFPRSQCQ